MRNILPLLLFGPTLLAQTPAKPRKMERVDSSSNKSTLFSDTGIVQLTLAANFKQFRRDARDTDSPYRPASFSYRTDSQTVVVPVRIKPRGIWRRKNCDMPPIRLNFQKDSVKKTIFAHQDRLKLVVHCRNNDDSEQNLLQEYQLYRVHNLLTPFSYRARLVKVTYVDAEKRDTLARRYAFLMEEPEGVGARLGAKVLATKGASANDLQAFEDALLGVWQYFIGNTDFSIAGLHNITLLQKDMDYYAVAHDYDWTGVVRAPYAKPDYRLPIKRVTERLMRGYCAPPEEFDKAFALFRDKKDAIYALYRDQLGALLKPDLVKNTLSYYDEFYETINDQRRAQREIVKSCLEGTA